MAGESADVFVSYKAEDRARLAPLVEALNAEGFSVWWDRHIGGGVHWREEIQEHLDIAKCVIVAWTRRSVGPAGDFVRDEASRARKRGSYLPISLDAVEPPLGFGEIQAISLKGWQGDRSDPRFLALADAVRQCVSGERVIRRLPDLRRGVSRRVIFAGGISIGAVTVAGVGGGLLLRHAPADAKRIAVLPFANLSDDPAQAYFSDGIAEELRSALARIGMQVIGRTSSDAVKDIDAKIAGAQLGVPNVLTGSVRRSSETIRVDTQLVSAADGVERWAQTYDRAPGDAIKIQTDIAQSVAKALSLALGQVGRAALTLGGTADAAAQDLILKSRKLSLDSTDAEILRRRVGLAEAAIARDPKYAEAYVEKADALYYLAINYAPTAREVAGQAALAAAAARKAVALAPRLGTAHAVLAQIAEARLDFTNALRETKVSLALSPEDPNVLTSGSLALVYFGNAGEAVRLIDRAIALDPLNPRPYAFKSFALTFVRRYLDAIDAGRKALTLAPQRRNTRIWIGDALLLLGQPGKAKVEYEEISTDSPFRLARLALLAAHIRNRGEAERITTQLKQQQGDTDSYQYAQIYAQLGDNDRAFAEFDNAIRAIDSGLSYLKVDPFLDPIRNDLRYTALLRKLNFP